MRLLFIMVMLSSVISLSANSLESLTNSSGQAVRYGGRYSDAKILIPEQYFERKQEMRGVWMATISNLDFGKNTTEYSFKKEFCAKLDVLLSYNINTLVFQVRPSQDAFYASSINPWSRYLTGVEGRGIANFDPMQFMITECHRRGIAFHAWLNPYRIIPSTKLSKMEYLNTLSPLNFARKYPNLVLESPVDNGGRMLFLNPGEPAVIRHLVSTVGEILAKYPVDAIHFDDYFYPYSGFGNDDASSYKRYGAGRSLEMWRRNNVTVLVKSVKNIVDVYEQKRGRKIEFGISPFGIWANKKTNPYGSLTGGKQALYTQYADTRQWVKFNLVDYIVPQIYWEFAHDVAAYAAVADWWNSQVQGTNVKLYMGLGAYKLGSAGAWSNPKELVNQLRYNTKLSGVKGNMIFSSRNLIAPANKVMSTGVQLIKSYWRHRVNLHTSRNKHSLSSF